MNPVNLFIIFCIVLFQTTANAQQKDSLIIKSDSVTLHQKGKDSLPKKDSIVKKKHDPHKATLYSAILPGAGQIYNKKYWKLPLVYAAIGIPAYTYFYNKTWYKKCQYAFAVAVTIASSPNGISGSTQDSLNSVDPKLQGLAGAGAKTIPSTSAPQPTPHEKCADDAAFFREILQQGQSLVVVRTESPEIAKSASRRLDCLGLGLRPLSPAKMQVSTRQACNVAVIDISGKITHGEGNVKLREIVRDLLGEDNNKILLNLGEVHYIDSSGMGELVRIYISIRNQGGEVKLVNPSRRVQDLLQMTRLTAVFQIEQDEAAAIASLRGPSPGDA